MSEICVGIIFWAEDRDVFFGIDVCAPCVQDGHACSEWPACFIDFENPSFESIMWLPVLDTSGRPTKCRLLSQYRHALAIVRDSERKSARSQIVAKKFVSNLDCDYLSCTIATLADDIDVPFLGPNPHITFLHECEA